jgi:hypothetical protein
MKRGYPSEVSQNLTVVTLNNTNTVSSNGKLCSANCKGITSAGLGGSLLNLGTKLYNGLNNLSLKGTTNKLFQGTTIKNVLADLNSLKSSINIGQLINKIKF